jgi:hypothetical protein
MQPLAFRFRRGAFVSPPARRRSKAARASGVTTQRGFPHNAEAVFTAASSPRAIHARTLSGETR